MDTALERPRWTRLERIPILALLLAYIPGTPGLGIETRETAGIIAVVLGVAYAVAWLAPLIGLGASWKWPRAAAWSALAGGALATVLSVLDLMGALAGPAPTAIVVVDVVVAVLGAAVAWRSWALRA